MASDIAFYFDFSSPYGYLAAEQIGDLEAETGREVQWRPILLGALFKTTGSQPLVEVPLKGDYSRRDMARAARLLKVPFVFPEKFPYPSIAACRAFYALCDQDRKGANGLALALYRRAFNTGQSIEEPREVIETAQELGIDGDWLASALSDQAIKDRLRREVDTAREKGVFGSPFFLVDGEPFWGHDRLSHVRLWATQGGW